MKVRSRPNSSRRRILRTVVIAGFFVGVGMLLPLAISTVATLVMYPVHTTNVWLRESSDFLPTFIRDRQSLQAEIESLNNQLEVSKGADLTKSRLVDENNRLRRLLGADGENRIAASIIARPNELPYDFLQIDRGSQNGIEIGSPVFIGKDVVIGLVVYTASDYSFVELITTPGFEATAFISGPNVVATLEGYGGGVARVRVPQGIPLSVGNLVYLPSIEPGVFGRISHVENRPTQPEQYGYISPEVAISSLNQVAVGKLSQVSHSASEIEERVIEQMRTELLVDALKTGDMGTTTDKATSSQQNSL